jgi:subtilisin family serine protease
MGRRGPAAITIATVTVTAMMTATATAAAANPTPAADSGPSAMYLVQFDAAPLATYTGGVDGIAGTKPAAGTKLDTKSWNYNAYREHIRAQRTNLLGKAKVAGKKVIDTYDNVINGVSMELTGADVARLSATPGVAQVWKQSYDRVDTADTPGFLGLTGASGVWQQRFGGAANAGEGTIVGILDSGFTPENPSFAALPEPRPDADIIAGKWHGECVPGTEEPVTCNNKVLGARYYFDASTVIIPQEFESPRDFDGHGSHTASTAAGNNGVTAIVNGENVGSISGMAPAARLAIYKVCWEVPDLSTATCGALQRAKAIDDAVSDGVDVLNHSIGGSATSVTDVVNVAFLHAAAAGVFVANSAGNTPGASTVTHNAPWVTTVAASTHDRTFEKSVTLGNGTTYTSAGQGGALPSSPLVDSVTAGLPGRPATDAELCFIGALDPAKVTGKIVLCQRGVSGRTEKSRAVQQAGGVGMIMYNPAPNSINADFHAIPTVHVGETEGAAIKAYIAGTASPTASMTPAVRKLARAPQVASFSSQGPARAGGGDLLKPDISAPGVDVIAAVAPGNNFGNDWDALSGTSMASPHVAGIAALLKSANPGWTPAAVRSAMMTTAYQTDNTGAPIQREGGAPATPFDFGAGHVRPAGAFDPGLVYDSGPLEWLQYACGIGQRLVLGDGSLTCDLTGAIDPSDLNYPSISVGDLVGTQTVTRSVQNATNQASVYVPKVQAPPGVQVKVTPPVLTVLPRKSATYKVEFTRTTAAFGVYAFGSITWSDLRGHSARSPLAVRPVALTAPAEVARTGVSGSHPMALRVGFGGQLVARPFGLTESAVTTRRLTGTQRSFSTTAPAEGPAVLKTTVTIPAGTKLARLATFNAQYPAGTDLDLFVYGAGQTQLLKSSAGATADELIVGLEPGTYDVYLVQFATAVPNNEQDVHLHAFTVPASGPTSLTVTPASQQVQVGANATVTASWSGLTAGRFYLGVVDLGDGRTVHHQTVFTVAA